MIKEYQDIHDIISEVLPCSFNLLEYRIPHLDLRKWCEKNCKGKYYIYRDNSTIYFKSKIDAILFRMIWI